MDNHVEVSGQVAVMAINENLLRTIMAKNPDFERAHPSKGPAPVWALICSAAAGGQAQNH